MLLLMLSFVFAMQMILMFVLQTQNHGTMTAHADANYLALLQMAQIKICSIRVYSHDMVKTTSIKNPACGFTVIYHGFAMQ